MDEWVIRETKGLFGFEKLFRLSIYDKYVPSVVKKELKTYYENKNFLYRLNFLGTP